MTGSRLGGNAPSKRMEQLQLQKERIWKQQLYCYFLKSCKVHEIKQNIRFPKKQFYKYYWCKSRVGGETFYNYVSSLQKLGPKKWLRRKEWSRFYRHTNTVDSKLPAGGFNIWNQEVFYFWTRISPNSQHKKLWW